MQANGDANNGATAPVPNAANDANMANVYAATVKLPDFWQHNPRPWFQHIEAQFQLRGITQDTTKYFHVVAALECFDDGAGDDAVGGSTGCRQVRCT